MNRKGRISGLIGISLVLTGAVVRSKSLQQTLSVDVRMVEVYVSVFDGKGNRVPNLQKENFELSEDGVKQKIDVFESQTSELTTALLIDTTGSMVKELPQVKNAIADLLTLVNPEDQMGLFAFSNRLTVLQPFTTDRNALLGSLLRMRPAGSTALYDSLAQLARDLSKGGGKKVILLFTDGLDNGSVLTLESAIVNVRRIGVPVYTVAQGEMLHNRDILRRLKDISESTNGVAFESRRPDDVREIFRRIGRDLQHLYLLGYYSTNNEATSEWRRLNVRLLHSPNFNLRAKEGYWR